MGLVLIAFGVFFILMGLGIITPDDAAAGSPAWLPVCCGLVFAAGGATIILTACSGRSSRKDGAPRIWIARAMTLKNAQIADLVVDNRTPAAYL
jgi:hypothetical protein